MFFENPQFFSEYASPLDERYSIIDVEVTSSSFLYRMIRKTLGVAVSVANRKTHLEQISQMFATPEKFYDDKSLLTLKPNGLFLKKVVYKDPVYN